MKPNGSVYGGLTTPDPVALHRTLAELAGEGVTHLAFEASSHGLDQFRLDGVRLKAAAFTNLGRDHLDYHPTMEAYLAAKLRLFTELLPPDGTAVINVDAEHARRGHRGDAPALAAGSRPSAPPATCWRWKASRPMASPRACACATAAQSPDIRLPLLGAYQASNALLAAGLVMATGAPADRVLSTLPKLEGVKGRLEIMGLARGGLVVIDYAHKPDALAAALKALRPFAPGRLVCVFGCGGDRDKGKRPIMGRIAAVSSPTRSSSPTTIREARIPGRSGPRSSPARPARAKSATAPRPSAPARRLLGAGDVLLVAGKGHETGQIIGSTIIPFSDHDAVRDVLTEKTIQ